MKNKKQALTVEEMVNKKTVRCITINTDAAFHPKYRIGGYAFYIVCDLFKIQKGGMFKKQPKTAEEAEIMCIGNAISTLLAQKELPFSHYLVINNDCKFGMERIKKKHRKSKDELGKTIHNMWVDLTGRLRSKKNSFRYVKAHNGTPDARSYVNDWCDREAKKWMWLSINNSIEKQNAGKEKNS